ncbi:MAG: chemotaxis protein CheD [Rhodobacteraceae bacterium]|nr:chemotaxis protein CheD [Paracoccaceae bacterium]
MTMVERSKTDRSGKVYVAQGEYAIGAAPEDVISAILGSCVAVCLWDELAQVGGMNHILLPELDKTGSEPVDRSARIGAYAMETLINALIRKGALKGRMGAKVFGGASIVKGLSDIGERNANFAMNYLKAESIGCDAKSLGGSRARQVRFWPFSGQARQRFVPDADIEILAPQPQPGQNTDIEIF